MKYQRKQKGFTLIELMIVVTILGILASIAIPTYRDYTIRARVSECASLYSPIKTSIALVYSGNGSMPARQEDVERLGHVELDIIKGDYVAKMEYELDDDDAGIVTCTLTDEKNSGLGDAVADGGASGGKLTFIARAEPGGSVIRWKVSVPDDDETALKEKYWPI